MPTPRPRRISDFKPLLTNLAQTSHYQVTFGGTPPQLATYLARRGVDSRFITGELGLLCYSASLPFATTATTVVAGNYMGVQEKIAHSRVYAPITMEFYVDKQYKTLKFLEHWMEFMASGSHNPIDGEQGSVSQGQKNYFVRMQYPDYYKMDETKIVKFEKDYSPRNLEYTFFGLFPSNVSNPSISYDQSRTLTASATFEYTRYVCGPIRSIDQKRGSDNNKQSDNKEQLFYSGVAPKSTEEIWKDKAAGASLGTYEFPPTQFEGAFQPAQSTPPSNQSK